MKTLKLLTLIVCVSALWAGCASNKCCTSTATASCGHKCCIDAKTDCAHCPVCMAKK